MTTPIDDNLTLQDRIPVVERQSEEALLQAKREKSETIDLSEPMPQTYHGDDGQNGLHPLIPVGPLTAGESAEPPPETEIEPENEGDEGDVTLSLILNGGETRIPEQIKEEPPSPSKARKRGVPKPRPISPIIIEELDTPATRREKHLARKLRKAAERAAAMKLKTVATVILDDVLDSVHAEGGNVARTQRRWSKAHYEQRRTGLRSGGSREGTRPSSR